MELRSICVEELSQAAAILVPKRFKLTRGRCPSVAFEGVSVPQPNNSDFTEASHFSKNAVRSGRFSQSAEAVTSPPSMTR